MSKEKFTNFSNRLIDAMKENRHTASRSPSGICIKTLSEFAGVSEQICRRYIRGDALPSHEKLIKLASQLNVSPGWLLFGEQTTVGVGCQSNNMIDDELMHYILRESHALYQDSDGDADDYANFAVSLIREVREIDTTKENLEKIINLALGSISSYKKNGSKAAI